MYSGDSGSIVIGADSPTFVFGHVAGSNPLGEVYVSPLEVTMKLIMGLLETTHVSLPEPLPLLSGLATYHLGKGDDYAFEILSYLDGLIQTSQQTSDWSSMESWALCYQRLELLEAVRQSLRAEKDLEKVSAATNVGEESSTDWLFERFGYYKSSHLIIPKKSWGPT